MVESLAEQVRVKVEAARPLYHRLVVIVGRPGSGKTRVLLDVAEKHGWPYVNVNLELTGRLLELTRRQRALRTPQILTDIVNAGASDVALQQDPLKLLQGLSRPATIRRRPTQRGQGRTSTANPRRNTDDDNPDGREGGGEPAIAPGPALALSCTTSSRGAGTTCARQAAT